MFAMIRVVGSTQIRLSESCSTYNCKPLRRRSGWIKAQPVAEYAMAEAVLPACICKVC